MPWHYAKSTVSAVEWCDKCWKKTEHRVDDGRRGPCLVCLAKLEAAPKPQEPPAEQMGLFGGKA